MFSVVAPDPVDVTVELVSESEPVPVWGPTELEAVAVPNVVGPEPLPEVSSPHAARRQPKRKHVEDLVTHEAYQMRQTTAFSRKR